MFYNILAASLLRATFRNLESSAEFIDILYNSYKLQLHFSLDRLKWNFQKLLKLQQGDDCDLKFGVYRVHYYALLVFRRNIGTVLCLVLTPVEDVARY